MNAYETTFILDPELEDEAIEAEIARVEDLIKAHGGEVTEQQRWGRRKLAYEIKRRQMGYYVHLKFHAPGSFIDRLHRQFRLNEAVLRYLTILLEKNIEEKLEAQGAAAPQPGEE